MEDPQPGALWEFEGIWKQRQEGNCQSSALLRTQCTHIAKGGAATMVLKAMTAGGLEMVAWVGAQETATLRSWGLVRRLWLVGCVPLLWAQAAPLTRSNIPVAALVGTHVGALAEDPGAKRASVGLLPCVQALMRNQVGLLREALGTAAAGVGLLPRVDADVGHQVGLAAKLLGAYWAHKGAVDLGLGRRQSARQLRDKGLTLGAGQVGVREGPAWLEHLQAKGVQHRVLALKVVPGEGIQGVAWGRQGLPGVYLLVGDEVGFVPKALATLAADVGLLPSVDVLVGG